MKVLVVGKHDFSNLLLNTFLEFSKNYNTQLFETQKFRRLRKYLISNLNFILFEKQLNSFEPDLVFIVAPYFLSIEYFKILQSFKSSHSNTIIAGWVGDNFDPLMSKNRFVTEMLDIKFITDTGFQNYFSSLDSVCYLPLATTDKIFYDMGIQRKNFTSFVASHTTKREKYLTQVNFSCQICGTGWKNFSQKNRNSSLTIDNKKLSIKETSKLYNSSVIVLNFNNENNTINGVNQRTFDPFLCGALVVQEYCGDLELNFDIEKEILSFKSTNELNEIAERLKREPCFINSIVEK